MLIERWEKNEGSTFMLYTKHQIDHTDIIMNVNLELSHILWVDSSSGRDTGCRLDILASFTVDVSLSTQCKFCQVKNEK